MLASAHGHVHKPTEKKERNVLSEDKIRGILTRRVHKAKRESPQKQGLPGKKKGDRENLSPVYGGGWFTTQELSIRTQACQRVLGRECEVVIKT